MGPSRVYTFRTPTLMGGHSYMMHRHLLWPFFTFPLRTFHFSSDSFISVLLVIAATSQVCSGVDCDPGGSGIWLMQFGTACSLTCKGDGYTVYSGFLYDFSIKLMLATFKRFCVTIYHFPSLSYLSSPAKSFYRCDRLFFFHCTGYSLLNFFSARFLSLLDHCLLL